MAAARKAGSFAGKYGGQSARPSRCARLPLCWRTSASTHSDWLLEKLGLSSVRYADDIVVLATSAQQAAQALEQLKEWMRDAGLDQHRWPIRYFENLGLLSLERAREETVRLRQGAKC